MKFTFLIVSIVLTYLQSNYRQCNGQLLTTFNTPRWTSSESTTKTDFGERLILTPFIETGNVALARRLAKVDSELFLNVTSYSGYLTVNDEKNSNLFFWFFPARGTEQLYADDLNDYDGEDEDSDYDHPFLKKLMKRPKLGDTTRSNEEKPVILWLQGGPGTSSLFGLFTENGPFLINDDFVSIRENPHSWHQNYSMLYIDNPVGAGFSFTRSDGYATNVTQISKQLYSALAQFFDMFPVLQPNEFYIMGESYAGKYIPALAHEIYIENRIGRRIINLQGLAMGNAMSDPYNMNDYSDFAYQTGLVGHLGYSEMRIFESLFKTHYDTDFAKSFWDATLHSFVRHSQYRNLYNIRDPYPVNLTVFRTFIELPEVRRALHVGNQKFSDPSVVGLHLQPDFFNSAMYWTEQLLNAGLRIMYYSGNLDFILAQPLSQNTFRQMRWKGSLKYRIAERMPFVVGGMLKGYVTKVDNFVDATILNAGHMAPTDQPEACLELIDRFIKNEL